VIEADEYDTAFFDKRSKMVHYRPRLAVLNNIEFDHADIFADLASIETQFHHFVRTIPGSGKLIVNGADPAIDRVLARGCWSAVERFGVGDGWSANAVGTGCFEIFNYGRPVGLLRWDLQASITFRMRLRRWPRRRLPASIRRRPPNPLRASKVSGVAWNCGHGCGRRSLG